MMAVQIGLQQRSSLSWLITLAQNDHKEDWPSRYMPLISAFTDVICGPQKCSEMQGDVRTNLVVCTDFLMATIVAIFDLLKDIRSKMLITRVRKNGGMVRVKPNSIELSKKSDGSIRFHKLQLVAFEWRSYKILID